MLCYMGGSTKPAREAGKALALRRALLALQNQHASTARKFVALVGVPSGSWSRYVTGKQKPSEDVINNICNKLGVNGEERAKLLEYVRGTDEDVWTATTLPEQRAMLAAYLDIEDSSEEIREATNALIPGLGQIRAYAEAIMASGEKIGDVPREERLARVNLRIGRRDILTRKKAVTFVAFIGEAALAQVIGSPPLMADQHRYLLHLAKQPNVTIRVMPFGSGFHPALQGSFVQLKTKDGIFIHLEVQDTGLILSGENDRERFGRRFDAVAAAALDEEESQRLIAQYAERMEQAV